MTDPVAMLRAIADQTRLRILTLLSQRELCVCQLVDVLDEGQSKVSRHLAHLRNAGLVNDRREGLWVYYSLSEPQSHLHRLLSQWLPVAGSDFPAAHQDCEKLQNLADCGDLCANETADGLADTCGHTTPIRA